VCIHTYVYTHMYIFIFRGLPATARLPLEELHTTLVYILYMYNYIYICKYVHIYIYIYIYMYIHAYVYIYTCIYTHAGGSLPQHDLWKSYTQLCLTYHLYIYKHTWTYLYIYIYVYTHICVYMHVYIHMQGAPRHSMPACGRATHNFLLQIIYTYINIHIHVYMYIDIYVYTYMYIYTCRGLPATAHTCLWMSYGVATVSRILKIIGLFCRI